VSLEPDGDSTVLTLRHSLVTDETAIDYGCGWEDFLNRLHELVADRDPAAVVFSDAQQQLVPHWRAAERL
jgi:hypothetical protein